MDGEEPLQPGDILQEKSDIRGFKEHWILYLGRGDDVEMNADERQKLGNCAHIMVHMTNPDVNICTLFCLTVFFILCGIIWKKKVISAMVSLLCSRTECPVWIYSYGPSILAIVIATYFFGIWFFTFGAQSASPSSASFYRRGFRNQLIVICDLQTYWQNNKEKKMRKHNFKDAHTDQGFEKGTIAEIVARVNSELKDPKRYHVMTNNCEQFAHFCRYGKRYSGQVAAFSNHLKWLTFGLLSWYDEFD